MLNYIKTRFAKLVKRVVPSPVKRMLLISSIVNLFSQDEAVQERLIIQLNEHLKLAKEKGSMEFGLAVGKILWNDLSKRRQLLDDATDNLIEEIMSEFPEALRYAENDQVRKDLDEAIAFIREHIAIH